MRLVLLGILLLGACATSAPRVVGPAAPRTALILAEVVAGEFDSIVFETAAEGVVAGSGEVSRDERGYVWTAGHTARSILLDRGRRDARILALRVPAGRHQVVGIVARREQAGFGTATVATRLREAGFTFEVESGDVLMLGTYYVADHHETKGPTLLPVQTADGAAADLLSAIGLPVDTTIRTYADPSEHPLVGFRPQHERSRNAGPPYIYVPG